MKFNRLIFRVHAIERMFKRQITEEEVKEVLKTGEVIEDYPDDTPYPSQLILGWIQSRPLHVVISNDFKKRDTIIITVYEPDPEQWESGFRRRKR